MTENNLNEKRTSTYVCTLCGKKLIERKRSGIWHFAFGRDSDHPERTPVEMKIFGSLKMRCIRRTCRDKHPDHWNIFEHLSFYKGYIISSSIDLFETIRNEDPTN